jgi:hypothetical protein
MTSVEHESGKLEELAEVGALGRERPVTKSDGRVLKGQRRKRSASAIDWSRESVSTSVSLRSTKSFSGRLFRASTELTIQSG